MCPGRGRLGGQPFLVDQPSVGALLHRCGLGAAPMPARRLSAGRVCRALAWLPPPVLVTRGGRVASEDGDGTAVQLLERLCGDGLCGDGSADPARVGEGARRRAWISRRLRGQLAATVEEASGWLS
jgi:hypothetical protein